MLLCSFLLSSLLWRDTWHAPICQVVGTWTKMILRFCYYCSYGLCSDISVEYSMSQPFTFSRIWVPGCSSTRLLLTSPACEKQQAMFRVPPPLLFTITRCGGLWYSFCEVPGACFSYSMPRCNKVVRPGLLGSASTFYLWLTHQATLCHYCSTFKCGWSNIYWAAGQDALSSLL